VWILPAFEHVVLVLFHVYNLVFTNRAVDICTDCMGACVTATQRSSASISLPLTLYFQETRRCFWRQKTIYSRYAIQLEVCVSSQFLDDYAVSSPKYFTTLSLFFLLKSLNLQDLKRMPRNVRLMSESSQRSLFGSSGNSLES